MPIGTTLPCVCHCGSLLGLGRAGTFTSHSRDYSSVIAAIPILALLALCLLAGVVSLMGAAFQTAKHKGTPKAAGGMAGTRGSRAPRNPIHLLRWALLPLRTCISMLSRILWA